MIWKVVLLLAAFLAQWRATLVPTNPSQWQWAGFWKRNGAYLILIAVLPDTASATGDEREANGQVRVIKQVLGTRLNHLALTPVVFARVGV